MLRLPPLFPSCDVINEVVADVRALAGGTGLMDLACLVKRLTGHWPLPSPFLYGRNSGLFDGEHVWFDKVMFSDEQLLREVLAHEIVHVLTHTERWSHLNMPRYECADREAYLEALATVAGREIVR